MKSMKLTGIRSMEMFDTAVPEIKKEDEVLVKLERLGVCGSDVHYYLTGQIGSQVVDYPFTVGHECAGKIEKVGSGVSGFKPGDRVAVDPAMSCGKCEQCLEGREHTCRNLRFLGCPGQAEGALSEYIVMPAASCYKIKDEMSFDEAALSEPLSIGVYAVKQSIDIKGKKTGIFGSGPIGLSVLLAAKAQRAEKIYLTDKIDSRLKIASEAGADWVGNPDKTDIVEQLKQREPLLLDLVFECCGQQDAVFQAIEMLKPGGKLMIIGIPPELDNWQFPVDKLRRKEICIQNVRRQNECVHDALDMIDRKDFDVNFMVTHRYPFEKSIEAFETVADYADGVVKAMIDF